MEKQKIYNNIYNFRVKKYTLNIPIELYDKVKDKANKLGFFRVSIYVRALLEREIKNNSSISASEYINLRNEIDRYKQVDARREMQKNIKKDSWVKIKISKIYSLFNPKQQTFDFKK